MEYTFDIVNGFPRPLDDVESDGRALGADARSHIREMEFLNGPSSVEYGGESPWINVWSGSVRPDELPSYWVDSDASFEERVERIVENLMTFFDNSCTPHNTTVDDFEWTVRVLSESSKYRPEGVHAIQVVWKPK